MASLGPSSLRLLAQQRSTNAHGQTPLVRTQRVRLRSTCLYQTAQQPEQRREQPLERRSALAVGCSDRPAADLFDLRPSLRTVAAPRLRVAVDVDEVLGRFVYALNQYCKETHGMDYNVGDYWVYEFAKIWGCSQDMSNTIVHDFFKSPHFNQGIPIIPGAYDTLRRLSTFCDLVVVTSRQHIIQDVTLQWIDTHYPGLFSEVYFGNHFALQGTSRKKSEICRSIGAHVLIDDNPTYAADCADAGMRVLLFDWEHAYPWSKMPAGSRHPNIDVVRDWREAELALMALVPGSQA